MTSLRPVGRSSISLLRLGSSRVLNPGSPQGHHRGCRSVSLPLNHRPPKLPPLPPARGRGRHFEGTLPPSQPQMEGVLSRRWCAWRSCGANDWTVGVLRHGYCVPFHHLPPVSLAPKELLSSALGTVDALALQEEVNKTLLKGAVELVEQPEPGFYSQLFLVEKVTGGWRPVINLLSLNNFVTTTKFKMENVASVLESVRRGDWMFSINLQDTYFQIPVHQESFPYLRFCLEGRVYQFKALCFGLSTAPQVFTRVFALVSEWAHQKGMHLLRYLDDWLVVAESQDLLLCHQDLLLQLCTDLGIVVNWKKLDILPSTCLQYLGMVIDASLESVFPSQNRLSWFREVATSFLLLPPQPARLWQQLLGHMSSLERLLPGGTHLHATL